MTQPDNSSAEYPLLEVKVKTGQERFQLKGQELDVLLLDFWRWSASDLVNNALRGQLAEYIVAQALNITHRVRIEWDSYDLMTGAGTRIEVKSAAYLQSWHQKKLSSISFGIRPTTGWDAENSKYKMEVKRQADVYVFCVLGHKEKNTVNPLDLDQWEFYVLATSVIDSACPVQKTISLSTLQKLKPRHVKFQELALAIEGYRESTDIVN
ncbi:hypothetical protein [Spirosoma arcticum]